MSRATVLHFPFRFDTYTRLSRTYQYGPFFIRILNRIMQNLGCQIRHSVHVNVRILAIPVQPRSFWVIFGNFLMFFLRLGSDLHFGLFLRSNFGFSTLNFRAKTINYFGSIFNIDYVDFSQLNQTLRNDYFGVKI